MKQKCHNCGNCNKQIDHEEILCEQCVLTMERDILGTDFDGYGNIATYQGGCLPLLNKYVESAIKNMASKVTTKHASLKAFGDEASRRATFIGRRPSPFSDERADIFARWGFFYTGREDLDRCFHCGIGLREWSASDDPLKEHIRYSPDCQHLQNALMYSRSFNMNQILEVSMQCSSSQPQPEICPERSVRQLSTENNIRTMIEENRALKKKLTCIVCCRERKKTLFLPCHHLMVCQSCGTELEVCPFCRKPVREKIEVKFF